ncbi:isoamyl acetate-hydrolyzing esterase 1 homolog isoform X2 [Microtus ochrogaster]|uniref:Isoamyl acetate-hydrolyzing esterase 1 homolog n=1 Tax=Microtus ochrogaster TaxID=79684 RepID=A0ABM1URY2_MICOH|nr:isoamyl acetate-hydrolyzing esterase 1 homolog isoform X2 [Microtus ochrogaster]
MEERACRSGSQLRQPALGTRSFSKNPGHPSYRRSQSDGVEGEWAPTAPITDSRGPEKPAGGTDDQIRQAPPTAGSAPRRLHIRRGVRSQAPWRCASGLLAGALCSGLACCFSGTPSPSFLSSRVDGAHCWLTDLSGYNTRWAKIILPRLIKKENSVETPVAVSIFFGANDSSLKGENPKQHVPLDEYRANLRDMVQYLTSAGIPQERVILITPPPLHEAAWEKECILKGCKLNRLNAVVGEYADACVQAARDCGTDVLDLWALMQKDNQAISTRTRLLLQTSPEAQVFILGRTILKSAWSQVFQCQDRPQ